MNVIKTKLKFIKNLIFISIQLNSSTAYTIFPWGDFTLPNKIKSMNVMNYPKKKLRTASNLKNLNENINLDN